MSSCLISGSISLIGNFTVICTRYFGPNFYLVFSFYLSYLMSNQKTK